MSRRRRHLSLTRTIVCRNSDETPRRQKSPDDITRVGDVDHKRVEQVVMPCVITSRRVLMSEHELCASLTEHASHIERDLSLQCCDDVTTLSTPVDTPSPWIIITPPIATTLRS